MTTEDLYVDNVASADIIRLLYDIQQFSFAILFSFIEIHLFFVLRGKKYFYFKLFNHG